MCSVREEMKGGNVNGLRGRRLSLAFVGFLCTTFLVWVWEKNATISPVYPFRFRSPGNEQREAVESGEEPWVNSKKTKFGGIFSLLFLCSFLSCLFGSHLVRFGDGTGCNYSEGKWVSDKTRPLYSGFSCKQWLSPMWACRLTQRLDFAYESFRWQPDGCTMRKFEGSAFLRRMRDRTLAMVGDSLGRQQFQSLMCMITGGEERPDVKDVGEEYGLIIPPHAIRPDGWAYHFSATNTTILFYWSATLCELEPMNTSDPKTNFAMHLDLPATFLRQYLHRFDVLVLNTGHHWNRGKLQANRWIMYLNDMPVENSDLLELTHFKNITVHSVVKWLDSQLPLHPQLKAFFRTLSPRHFFNGDWNTGGTCDNTVPLSGGSSILQRISSDLVAESAVEGTRVRLLDVTGFSSLRDEAHMSRYSIKATRGIQDCLHWCLPGVPDTWNELLFTQL